MSEQHAEAAGASEGPGAAEGAPGGSTDGTGSGRPPASMVIHDLTTDSITDIS